jgi:hypothetical protein
MSAFFRHQPRSTLELKTVVSLGLGRLEYGHSGFVGGFGRRYRAAAARQNASVAALSSTSELPQRPSFHPSTRWLISTISPSHHSIWLACSCIIFTSSQPHARHYKITGTSRRLKDHPQRHLINSLSMFWCSSGTSATA